MGFLAPWENPCTLSKISRFAAGTSITLTRGELNTPATQDLPKWILNSIFPFQLPIDNQGPRTATADHCVTCITIVNTNKLTQITYTGKLTFVELAEGNKMQKPNGAHEQTKVRSRIWIFTTEHANYWTHLRELLAQNDTSEIYPLD